MRWIVIAVVLLGGCEDSSKGGVSKRRCGDERARLEDLGDPPQRYAIPDGVPVIEGATPVPVAEDDRLRSTFEIGFGAAKPTPTPAPVPPADDTAAFAEPIDAREPIRYVIADAGVLVETLYLDRQLGQADELRLVVRQPRAEVIAAYARLDPALPAKLRARLSTMTVVEAHEELLARTRKCDFGGVLDLIGLQGGPSLVGELASATLRDCQCRVDDVATVVSLTQWLSTPQPDAAYLVIRREIVAGLPPGARVNDLAAALAK